MNQAAAIAMIASFVRWVLTAAGAVEAAKSDSFVMQAAGVLVTIGCALWGQWKHYQTHKQEETPTGIPPTPPPPQPGKAVGLWLLLCFTVLGSGCTAILPGNDPVIVRAQQTEQVAFATFDTYVHIEAKYRDLLWKLSPDFKHVADKIRTGAPGWFDSFDAVLNAYKAHRTADNKASLAAGLAALEQSVAEAQGYLSRAVEGGAKP